MKAITTELTVDEMQQIMLDEMLGKKQSITGPAADKFLADFLKDVEKAKKDGVVLDIPSEWPSIGD